MKTKNALIGDLRRMLSDFTQPPTVFSVKLLAHKYNLSGDYEMWRIARFIFSDILSFKIYDQPCEKINWEIPFLYKNKHNCYIAHQKFGFRIYVHDELEEDAQKVAKQIEEKLYRVLISSKPLIEQYAKEGLLNGEIIVENRLVHLYKPYNYFKEKSLRRKKLLEKIFSTSNKPIRRNWYKLSLERDYFEETSYLYFFSMVEHICILFLGFRDISQRNDIVSFSRLNWGEKYKIVFDIKKPEFKLIYDHLIGLAKYRRNPIAHGYTNMVFDFYLEGARHKLPVLITDKDVAVQWQDQINNFDILDSFFRLIKKHPSTRNIFRYIDAGLNVSFKRDARSENDRIARMSSNDLREHIDYMIRLYDDAANMDW